MRGIAAAAIIAALTLTAAAETVEAQRRFPDDWPVFALPPVQQLQATEIVRFTAPEAGQGVAVDAKHVYAIGNFVIARYNRSTGVREAIWRGERGGLIGHLNSCFVEADELWCANSNHPRLPFANSIEIFDAATLAHRRTVPLGIMDEGSLVWFDRLGKDWIVGLAHYNDETGLPFKNNTFAGVQLHDERWRRLGGWALPESVIALMAPQAASGGAIGPDGLLYLMGHDRPEMYVLARPRMGPYLIHVATIAIAAEGQAFDFDESRAGEVCAISRPAREIRCFRLPAITLQSEDALRFSAE